MKKPQTLLTLFCAIAIVVASDRLAAAAPDLVATNGTLSIDTDIGEIIHDSGGGPVTNTAAITNNTATWTFGDLTIGSNLTSFTMSGTNAIKFVADGSGLVGLGNVLIETNLNLNGLDGTAANSAAGGAGRFGSGAGGYDDSFGSDQGGESAAADAYMRPGIGGGGSVIDRAGAGGGFGGRGGDIDTGVGTNGAWYGRLDLSDLGTAGGPRAGSGGGGGWSGSGASGGGAIQVLAHNDLTIAAEVSILANGSRGRAFGTAGDAWRFGSGGGGSGGGVRLVADWDADGTGTLAYADATLSATGGIAQGSSTAATASYGGDGGGGRVVLRGASISSDGAVVAVDGGAHGTNGKPGEDGSVLMDVLGDTLSLTGHGLAANTYLAYTSLTVSAESTLALGGSNHVGTLNINNNTGTAVRIDGTLAMDVDPAGDGSADWLGVTNELDITNATLDVYSGDTLDDDAYVIAGYGSLAAPGIFAATNVPVGYAPDYAYGVSNIALVPIGEIEVPPIVDFGIVIVGETSNATVSVTNAGAAVLTISGVATQGTDAALFTAIEVPTTIAPRSTSNIVVQYAPVAVGVHGADLEITSDDPDEGTIVIGLQGIALMDIPDIETSSTLDFGLTLTTTTNTLSLPVTNAGGVELALSDVSVSGADSNQFTTVSYPATVSPLMSSNIVVQYHPDVEGAHTADLVITSNDPNDSPTNVTLSGVSHASTTRDSRFDPLDVASIGTLSLASGDTLVFNTATLVCTTNGVVMGSGVVVTSESATVELAMFTFDAVNIGTGVTISVPRGNPKRGLVLGARESITLASTISINGLNGALTAAGAGGPGAEGGARDSTYSSAPPPSTAGNGGARNANGIGHGAGGRVTTATHAGAGGGFGGVGADAEAQTGGHGVTYGDAMLTDLYGGSGGSGGYSDRGADLDSSAGGGGGAIELTALDTITLSSTLNAYGGAGGNLSSQYSTRMCGGGGSGGGILLNAPSIVLTSSAVLNVRGGNGGLFSQVGGQGYGKDGGGGSGGRIAIHAGSSFTATTPTYNVANGIRGATVAEDGSLFIDEQNGLLYISGRGYAANGYGSYTSVTVSATSTLTVGGTNAVMTVDVNGDTTIAGTLAAEAVGVGESDMLDVSGTLTISGATLNVSSYAPLQGSAKILIARYGTLIGTFDTVNTELPESYDLSYTYNGNTIAFLPRTPNGALLLVR